MRNTKAGMRVALFVAVAALSPLPLTAQGVTAADFLISPPATRSDALGGVLDGLGVDLEGLQLNPAVLANLQNMRLQLNINPLPNEVTNSQLGVGFPLFGGTLGAGAQLLNTGSFTYINGEANPEATVTVYDAAAVLAYSREVWKSVSLGLAAKAIYSTLGDYNAFSVAADAGAAARFETPHIGQAPKAPTYEKLEADFEKEKKGIDAEKERRLKPLTEASAPIAKQIEGLEQQLADVEAKLAEATEDKRPPLEAKKAEIEGALPGLREQLAAAQEQEKAGVADVEAWYEKEMAAAQARFDQRVADLDWIEGERQRLFAVIDDPSQELSAATVDENVDQAITRSQDFLAQRRQSFLDRQSAFESSRGQRIQDLNAEIAGYKEKMSAETGPQAAQLNDDIASAKAERAPLQQADAKASKARIDELSASIAAKEKELAALLSDPWLKRLQGRIDAKNKEIEVIGVEIQNAAAATDALIETASAQTDKEIKAFEALRGELQTELKKAKLRRELDQLDAKKDKAKEKAQVKYKAKEKAIYERLLAAMYSNEEKIFKARLDAAEQDADARAYDFQIAQGKALEALEEEFAFQERFLNAKIAEAKAAGGDVASPQQELQAKRDAYNQGVADLAAKAKAFGQEEGTRLSRETQVLEDERQKVRLVYLQTDTPYLNTGVNLVMRNGGLPMTFDTEAYPLPASASLGVGYALLNTQLHNFKLSTQVNVPFYDELSVGVGAEYVFANFLYGRVGYAFNSVDRSFSTGFGAHLALGFTEYSVDYTFRPLPDYGFLHSIGVSVSF